MRSYFPICDAISSGAVSDALVNVCQEASQLTVRLKDEERKDPWCGMTIRNPRGLSETYTDDSESAAVAKKDVVVDVFRGDGSRPLPVASALLQDIQDKYPRYDPMNTLTVSGRGRM